jgi:hypothetical protein
MCDDWCRRRLPRRAPFGSPASPSSHSALCPGYHATLRARTGGNLQARQPRTRVLLASSALLGWKSLCQGDSKRESTCIPQQGNSGCFWPPFLPPPLSSFGRGPPPLSVYDYSLLVLPLLFPRSLAQGGDRAEEGGQSGRHTPASSHQARKTSHVGS